MTSDLLSACFAGGFCPATTGTRLGGVDQLGIRGNALLSMKRRSFIRNSWGDGYRAAALDDMRRGKVLAHRNISAAGQQFTMRLAGIAARFAWAIA